MFVLTIFFSLTGCVGGGGVRSKPVVVSGNSYASDSSPLYKEITLGSITGSNTGFWNTATGINITPEFLKAYRNKVGEDLDNAYLLSTDKKGDYLLDIAIRRIDSSIIGSGYTTKINYALKKSTGEVVWDKEITASHAVSFLKEPNSGRRLQKSKLGALTKNSEIYVRSLVNEAPKLMNK